MKKRRITYVVDVDFTDHIPEATIQLWADGIARGIEHNKDEVKNVEYIIQVRDMPEVDRMLPDAPPAPETERAERERLELPRGEGD